MKRIEYEEGEKFRGTLLSFIKEVEPLQYNSRKSRCALFLCECGNEAIAAIGAVRNGTMFSCGCLKKSSMTKHGHAKTRMYRTWKGMISRCTNPNNTSFQRYGGRGITVCQRWLCEQFGLENFISDMAEGYEDHLTLDRIDNESGYSPENCRWVGMSDQIFNRGVLDSNTSGKTGVYKENDGWAACITKDGVTYRLGHFKEMAGAVEARKSAELKYYGFHLNH